MKYVYKNIFYKVFFTIIDVVGNVLSYPFKTFRKPSYGQADRILLIRTDHIGDVINATCVLKPLRMKFPKAEIDLLVSSWALPIIEHDQNVDNVFVCDAPWFLRPGSGFLDGVKGFWRYMQIIRNGCYDVCVDLRGDFRQILAMYLARVERRISYGISGGGFLLTDNVPYAGIMHEMERNLELIRTLDVDAAEACVRLTFSGSDKTEAENIVSHEVAGRYAVLHLSPGHEVKKWDLQNFTDIIQYLFREKDLTPVIVGADSDRAAALEITKKSPVKVIDLTGKTNFGVLYNIIRASDLFIGVDSSPAHIASVAGVPTIVLFSGINDPVQWAPKGDKVKVIYPGKGKDLSAVGVEEVTKVIDSFLN